jgi:DNA-binding HxlR family transcriptional regulator
LLDAARAHEEVLLKKWSLPVLAALDHPRRFSEIRAAVGEVTPRSLAMTLRELETTGLVHRDVTRDHPPAVIYHAAAASESVVRHASTLLSLDTAVPAARGRRRRLDPEETGVGT